MLIPTHIEVFEDPEFCNNVRGEECPNLSHKIHSDECQGFNKYALKIDRSSPPLFKKCHECKEAYQTELKRRETLEEKEPDVIQDIFSEPDPVEKTGDNCDFDCEERGIKLMSGRTIGDCDKCPNTPPF